MTDEQRVREQQARVVLDHMYQFVGLLDPQGTFLDANQTALDGAGIRREDYFGRPFEEARWWQISPETQRRLRDALDLAGAGQFVRYDVDIFGAASGEEVITIDFNLIPVLDDSGAVRYLIAEGRNITEQKLAEAEVARQTAELQRLYDRIRELDAIKTDFFANVSHELRTPLALILGPVDRLLEDPSVADAPWRADLEVVRRNARTVLKHVNDLLDVSKLEAGRMEAAYVEADLAELVRRCASHFEGVARDRSIALEIEAPGRMPAQIDAEKLERVVLNLLSNAFKFSAPDGSVRVTLRTRGADSAAARAVLVVEDAGPGVPVGQRELIFERFRQAEGGAARRHGGTGLGLAIVKDFVALHGGAVSVGDSEHGGAAFLVELPLTAPAGAEVAAAPDTSNAGTVAAMLEELAPARQAYEPGVRTGRPLVLVVEDNPDMNRFVAETVAREYDVAVAFDGAEGLQEALRLRPSLIISDVMMPGTDGPAFLAEARRRPELDGIPFVMLTAKADEALAVRLLREGAQDHIAKPFSPGDLLARIGLHLRAASGSEPHATGFAVVDADGRLLRGNRILEEMLGEPAERLRGRLFADLAVAESRADLAGWLSGLARVEDSAPRQRDVRLRGAHASERVVSVVAVPVFDRGGALRSVSVQVQDLTETQAQSASELALALEAAGMGMWTWDLVRGQLTWSVDTRRVLGLSDTAEASLQTFLSAVHPEDRGFVEAELHRAISADVALEIEYRLQAPDGTVRWALSKGRVRRGPDDEALSMSGVVMDVTRRHDAEHQRAELILRDLQAAERATRLQQITAALSWATTTEEVAAVMADTAARMGAEAASVVLADDDGTGVRHLGATAGFAEAWDEHRPTGLPAALEPALVREAAFVGGAGGAVALLPLSTHGRIHGSSGRVRGAWLLAWPRGTVLEEALPEEERTYLLTVAGQCAGALGRTAVYEHEHDIATVLQRTLLPSKLPVVAGADLQARYLPGGRGVDVGGDWYDVIPLGGGRVGVVIGDVEGHSAAAAGVMGQVRNALRAYAVEGHSPRGVMERVNRLLTTLDSQPLATCCYLEFSPSGGTATVVVAGHPPPLLFGSDGQSAYLDVEPGLLLGVHAEETYVEKTVLLPPGSTLMLYTDGLVEHPESSVAEGLDRLRAVTQSCSAPHASRSRADALDCVISETLQGREITDDIAVLTLHYEPAVDRCEDSVSRRFPCDPMSAGAARRFITDVLEQWQADELVEATTLMVSELVSNAVLHTTGDLELWLTLAPERLRVAVRDESERMPLVRDPGAEETGGRGMLIIEALAESWGIEAVGSGKEVWFSVTREAEAELVSLPERPGVAV